MNFAEKFKKEFRLDKDDNWNNNVSKISVEDVEKKYLDDCGTTTICDIWNLINSTKFRNKRPGQRIANRVRKFSWEEDNIANLSRCIW